MFGSCKRIDWTDYKVAVPAYCVLFYIPFTYSILRGVVVGYVIYMSVGLYTGDLLESLLLFRRDFWTILCPSSGKASRALSEMEEHASHGSLSSQDDHVRLRPSYLPNPHPLSLLSLCRSSTRSRRPPSERSASCWTSPWSCRRTTSPR